MRVTAAALLVLSQAPTVLAHDGPHAAVRGRMSAWDAAVLMLLAAMAVLYLVGSRRLAARGAHVRRIERVSFWAGWAVLVAAVAPWMDAATELSFAWHMAQHELLMLVGAPLLIVGRPIVPWLVALSGTPLSYVGAVSYVGASFSRLFSVWRWMTIPLVAWALHGLAVWVWHLPAFYEAAVEHEAIHAFQHATFVLTAVCFWWGLVYGRYGRAAYGASVLFVFTTAVHTGVLGAIFALSTAPFYAVYRDRAALAGIDAVTDQQLAGLYMWIPAGVILTLFGLGLAMAWLSEADRRAGLLSRKTVGLLLPLLLALVAGCGIPHEREARALTGGEPARGRVAIAKYGCDTCHTIPGVPTADATVGPPLSAIARRTYLAGRLENTPSNMTRWIRNPHEIEPGTAMPDTGVSADDARDIVAYLYTLR